MERAFTVREEANALTCCAFRNGYIEELHAGKHSVVGEFPRNATGVVASTHIQISLLETSGINKVH